MGSVADCMYEQYMTKKGIKNAVRAGAHGQAPFSMKSHSTCIMQEIEKGKKKLAESLWTFLAWRKNFFLLLSQIMDTT